jgi:hypothetical protein
MMRTLSASTSRHSALDNHAWPLNLQFPEQIHHKKDFDQLAELSQPIWTFDLTLNRRH